MKISGVAANVHAEKGRGGHSYDQEFVSVDPDRPAENDLPIGRTIPATICD